MPVTSAWTSVILTQPYSHCGTQRVADSVRQIARNCSGFTRNSAMERPVGLSSPLLPSTSSSLIWEKKKIS